MSRILYSIAGTERTVTVCIGREPTRFDVYVRLPGKPERLVLGGIRDIDNGEAVRGCAGKEDGLTTNVRLLRPYGPSASYYALAADALVQGRNEDAARLMCEGDRAFQWELKMSLAVEACDEVLRRAGR